MDYAAVEVTKAPGRTLPDCILDYFVARVFAGALPAGERLPPERELATLLRVDRTSLRIAMQQLARMGVVKVTQGSGVRVLDFHQHAGLDFLAVAFGLPGLCLGGSYLLQMLDDWLDLMPVLVGRALCQMTPEQHRENDAAFTAQLKTLRETNRLDEVVEQEIAQQDRTVRVLGNVTLELLGNSSRPLRRRVLRMFFETVDASHHIATQRAMSRAASQWPERTPEKIASIFRKYLEESTQVLRTNLLALPMNPSFATGNAKLPVPDSSARSNPPSANTNPPASG